MKKILVVVCAVAFCLGAANAGAQTAVPYVQIYFDEGQSVTVLEECPTGPVGTLYVVAHNWNMWMAAIEYLIE